MKVLTKILIVFVVLSSVAFGQQANLVNGWERFLIPSYTYDVEKTLSYLEEGGYQTYTLVGYTKSNGSIYIKVDYGKDFSKIFSGGSTQILDTMGFDYRIKTIVGEKVIIIAIGLTFQDYNHYISDISCRKTIANPSTGEWEKAKFDMSEIKKSISKFDRVTIEIWIVTSEIEFVGAEISLNDLYGEDSLGVKTIYDSFDITDAPGETLPATYSLSQNYPNPFNPATKINYSIEKAGMVSLKIYDILGRVVADLVNKHQESGSYTVDFNASKLSTGVYFYKLESGSFSSVKKMMLIK